MQETIIAQPEEPKKSKTGMIIGIVAALLCCCCLVLVVTLWFTGDSLMQMLNTGATFAP